MKRRLNGKTRFMVGAVLVAVLVSGSQVMAGDIPVPAEGQKLAELTIGGMTCASCTIPIKAALKKAEGAREVEVNYREKKAYVVYDPAITSPELLAEAVNNTKIFSATPPEKEKK